MVKNKLDQKFYTHHYSESALVAEKIEQANYLLTRTASKISPTSGKLLDIGCGIGLTAVVFAKHLNLVPHGVEVNPVAIKKSERNGVKIINADLNQKLPYSSNSFSLVLAVEIIEHVFNPDLVLSEINRVLTNGGYLILTTPNLASWFNRILLLFGFQPFYTEVSTKDKTIGLSFTRRLTKNREPLGHLRVFTFRALSELLDQNGFTILSQQGNQIKYLPRFMQLVDRLFSKNAALAGDMIVVARKK